MPLYEYECEKCHKIEEVMQKISDGPLEFCGQEGCDGKLTKLMSMSSFSLKGTGWYTTDYKSKPSDSKSSPKE